MENLPKKVRSRKLSTRVDLTAMVSVSFLLIIFFMVTIELAKPKIMSLSLPDKDYEWNGVIRCGAGMSDRIITLLLDENDQIIVYDGYLSYPLESESPKKMKYGKEGIRNMLTKKNNYIHEYYAQSGRPNRGAIVIIKPSKKSNFKNLVDILDEMEIAKIETYAIVNDFSPEEIKLLASN